MINYRNREFEDAFTQDFTYTDSLASKEGIEGKWATLFSKLASGCSTWFSWVVTFWVKTIWNITCWLFPLRLIVVQVFDCNMKCVTWMEGHTSNITNLVDSGSLCDRKGWVSSQNLLNHVFEQATILWCFNELEGQIGWNRVYIRIKSNLFHQFLWLSSEIFAHFRLLYHSFDETCQCSL